MTKRKEPAGGGEVVVEAAAAAGGAAASAAVEVDLIAALGGYDKMISQGAEGRVFAVQFLQRPTIIKQRFKKTYRHPSLDAKLTKSRLNMEARSITRARKLGVVTPTIYYVDTQQSAIYMEHVVGKPLKDLIRAGMSDDDMKAVGRVGTPAAIDW
jgi:TP53 regulating kinase-like protein